MYYTKPFSSRPEFQVLSFLFNLKETFLFNQAGFQLIDAFAKSQGILMNKPHCKAIFGEGMLTLFISPYIVRFLLTYLYCSSNHGDLVINVGFVGDVPVFLAKPQTYMNLSGESVSHSDIYFRFR